MTTVFALCGAHLDRRARLKAPHVPMTSNPATMIEEVGGGVLNVARALRRMSVSVRLLSVRGGDRTAEVIARAIADAGIEDVSSVHLDRSSPSYTAILDHDGELVTAVADMDLYETGVPRAIRRSHVRQAIAGADALLVDTNAPSPSIADAISFAATGAPVFAMAISAAKVVRLRPVLNWVSLAFLNLHEARALCDRADLSAEDAVDALRAAGVRAAVISDGARPAHWFDDEAGERGSHHPPVPDRVIDVTGAGDAMAGVIIAKRLSGMALGDCVPYGLSAAARAVAETGCAPDFLAAGPLLGGHTSDKVRQP